MPDLIAVVGIGIVGMLLTVLLKQYKPEYAAMLSLGIGVIIVLAVAGQMLPIFAQMEALLQHSRLPGHYLEILAKSLGICFLAQLGCDACRDAGESAIGAKVELAGKVAMLTTALPLFSDLLSVVSSLLQ